MDSSPAIGCGGQGTCAENKQDEADRASSMEDLMRLMIICFLGVAIFAAPCIYDISSQEPSPLAGLVTAASTASSSGEQRPFEPISASRQLLF
ncbi:hypothetical protein U5G49_002289 [Rhizobium indigoferae]|uniref:Exopeptide n=2 Tax=Rhizobium indigoferae TaxID=158891 RepID=A0ABZ0ZC73_9HYPH|nr:hypothetical protein [Rhizobium indigoferae]WQN37175.1 hypothetical protein U5G49_002289 [Rhizobium indigoferae]